MIEQEIESLLESVRPMLALHRGGVEFVSYDDATKTVHVRLIGTCKGCALADLTLKEGIEEMMRQRIPEIRCVESVP